MHYRSVGRSWYGSGVRDVREEGGLISSRFEDGRCRGVAQPGSAPALGAGSRRFKSSRPDQSVGRYCGITPTSDVRGAFETEGRNLQDDGFPGTKYSWSEVFRACSSARIEQRPPKPCVRGSNPPRRAKQVCMWFSAVRKWVCAGGNS